MREVMKGKTEIIERMSTKFVGIDTAEKKDFAAMCMTAYEAGREAGRKEQESKQAVSA
jgi:hypothetical protein